MTPYRREEGGPFYIKVTIQGQGRVQRCLDTWDIGEARKRGRALARDLRAAAAAGRFASADAATRSRQVSYSTIQAVVDVYRLRARVKARTVQSNVHCLASVLRHAGEARGFDAPVSVLTKALVRAFQDALVLGKAGDELDTARTNANSLLRQARSVFSRDLVEDGVYESAGIKLHDLSGFRQARMLEEPSHQFHPLTKEQSDKIWAGARELKQGQPQVYIAFLLSACLGMRRGEAANLRWSQVLELDGARAIRLGTTKNGMPRLIPVEDAVWAEICEASKVTPLKGVPPSDDFILAGPFTRRWRDTFDGLTAFLESLGWDRRKKAHELRKWAGARMAQTLGTRTASMILGNTEEVFRAHYDGMLELPKVALFKAG
jgi:integrase